MNRTLRENAEALTHRDGPGADPAQPYRPQAARVAAHHHR
jgi:hypothetical protein